MAAIAGLAGGRGLEQIVASDGEGPVADHANAGACRLEDDAVGGGRVAEIAAERRSRACDRVIDDEAADVLRRISAKSKIALFETRVPKPAAVDVDPARQSDVVVEAVQRADVGADHHAPAQLLLVVT